MNGGEPDGYGRWSVYEKIWKGKLEEYNPWEASCRILDVSDLYAGAGVSHVAKPATKVVRVSKIHDKK